MHEKITVKTESRVELVDITAQVSRAIKRSGVKDGLCVVFIPHTTAAVTINENADPDVRRDICYELDKIVPMSDGYHHMEGNSAAHIKASMFGFSETVIIESGEPLLGTWQGIYFCEFDGPRNRRAHIRIMEAG